MSRGFASNYRLVLIAIGLFGCFAALGARLVCLHVVDRDQLVRNIVKTRRQTIIDPARRGDILDATGTAILATSCPMVRVAVDPMMFSKKDETKLSQLAELLDMPLEEVRRICLTQYRKVANSPKPTLSGAKASATTNSPVEAKEASLLKVNLPTPVAAKGQDESDDEAFGRQVAESNDDSKVAGPDVGGTADAEEELDDTPDAQGLRPIRWVVLKKYVAEDTFDKIKALGIAGLCAPERRFVRVYPHNDLAAHLIGYANAEGKGAAGVEWYSDFYLRGQNGWREGEKDGRQHELAQFQTREVPRADGYSVRLSIDQAVQDIVEIELDRIAKTYQPLKATIIVSRPNTGFILGMANYPTFNPNEYSSLPKDQWSRMRNIAVSDSYEPGSVFKIVAASAALEEGLVTAETTFNCTTEKIAYKGKEYSLKEDHHFDHPLTVAEIISHSSNRGAAQLAILVGEEKFEHYAHEFGFGEKLGFPFGGESPGIFHPRARWHPKDFTRIPMGQAVTATALQMHQAMATIASGGVLYRPQIISEVRDPANNVVLRYRSSKIDQVISPQTAYTMCRLLQGVASPNGTAKDAAIKINGIDYEVAGKTGTAQKYIRTVLAGGRVKYLPSTKNHVVSFVGFFPASNPQVAISVVIDDADAHCVGGVAYGAAVAAPVFKRIGEKLIPILSIVPPNQSARSELAAVNAGGRR